MLVSIKGVSREDVGVKEPAETPPLGGDREPDHRVSGMVVGGEGVRDIARGESKVLVLEDSINGGKDVGVVGYA